MPNPESGKGEEGIERKRVPGEETLLAIEVAYGPVVALDGCS